MSPSSEHTPLPAQLPEAPEQYALLQMVSEISRALSSELDLDALLAALYHGVRRVIDVSRFFIALHDEGRQVLQVAYLVDDNQHHTIYDQWPIDVGLSGVVLRRRVTINTDDYDRECARHGIAPARLADLPMLPVWLGIPLIARDRVEGVLGMASARRTGPYAPQEVALLEAIAAQAAVAIQNARLIATSDRQARQLESLHRLSRVITSSLDAERVPLLVMEQVQQLLGVDEGSLLLVPEDGAGLEFAYALGPTGNRLLGERLSPHRGIAGAVMETGAPMLVNDAQHHPRFDPTIDQRTGYHTRAVLAVPMRGVDGIRGVIEVINKRDGSPFTQEDAALLAAFADVAVIALDNARRFAQVDRTLARRLQELDRTNEQLQQNLRVLTALNALGMAINSTLRSPADILALTAMGMVEITGAISATALLRVPRRLERITLNGLPAMYDEALAELAEAALGEARPLVVTAGQHSLPPAVLACGASVLVIVPLRGTTELVGAICVAYRTQVPGPAEIETLNLFAGQAAVAAENLQLLSALREGRDKLVSIMTSTREGMMLIDPSGHIAVANPALALLCGLSEPPSEDVSLAQFLETWNTLSPHPAAEWASLLRGLELVAGGAQGFATGRLTQSGREVWALEWAVMPVRGVPGGLVMVLRDTTEARAAERLRNDLTNMIVHDLRSPLGALMAAIGMLFRGVLGTLTSDQQRVLTIANTSAQQMLDMVNTLLDISRLETGRLPLDCGPVRLHTLISQVAAQLDSLARDSSCAILVDVSEELPPAYADEGLVARVVQNLIGNAIKFGGRGGTVLVRGGLQERQGDQPPMLLVSVHDRGAGIAPEDLDKIFEKFAQVGKSRGSGSGLGLTFCKLVIEAHGGRIWVESALNHGSTFTFTLPAL